MWFMEEVGELTAAAPATRMRIAKTSKLEFADVLAWLATLANIANVDLDEAVQAEVRVWMPEVRCDAVCSASRRNREDLCSRGHRPPRISRTG